jgi:photosystem II stability/assembly factor-like uncharacterized protein
VITDNRLLTTSDYGATWTDSTPAGVTPAQLGHAGLAVLDGSHQWLAVTPATATTGTGPATATVYRSSGPGTDWQATAVSAIGLQTVPGAQLSASLSFATATDGWLLIGQRVTNTGSGTLLRTTDGGMRWTVAATPRNLPGIGTLQFVSSTVGFMKSPVTGRTWTTRDSGATWSPFDLPVPPGKGSDTATMLALPAHSGSSLVAAVGYAKAGSGAADGVAIYRSDDVGASWTVTVVPAAHPDESYAFAVAPAVDAQALLRTQALSAGGARTWTLSIIVAGVANPAQTSFPPADVASLAMSDATRLWAVAQNNGCTSGKSGCFSSSALLRTEDAGSSWVQVSLPN